MWSDVMSCLVTSCHVMSCLFMSCHVLSCDVMWCYVMWCIVMLCDVIEYDSVCWNCSKCCWRTVTHTYSLHLFNHLFLPITSHLLLIPPFFPLHHPSPFLLLPHNSFPHSISHSSLYPIPSPLTSLPSSPSGLLRVPDCFELTWIYPMWPLHASIHPDGSQLVIELSLFCFAMLCFVLPCCIFLCYVVLCYDMLWYVVLCRVVWCGVVWCGVVLYSALDFESFYFFLVYVCYWCLFFHLYFIHLISLTSFFLTYFILMF